MHGQSQKRGQGQDRVCKFIKEEWRRTTNKKGASEGMRDGIPEAKGEETQPKRKDRDRDSSSTHTGRNRRIAQASRYRAKAMCETINIGPM